MTPSPASLCAAVRGTALVSQAAANGAPPGGGCSRERAARIRTPSNISYGIDDAPPLEVNLLSGLQHVCLMSIYLVYPALVAKAAGASPEVAAGIREHDAARARDRQRLAAALLRLIGMTAGYLVSWLVRGIDAGDEEVPARPLFALPVTAHDGWSFESALVLPFAVAAVAASLKAIANVTTSQKANDADWVRADMRSISHGVVGDGLGSVVAGVIGAHDINSSTSNVGLASATGVTARRVAYPVAALLLVLAFVPRLGLIFYMMPRPVAGAALVFSSTFIIINGLEIMTSRMLESRKTIVIGLALIFGLAVEVSPGLLSALPQAERISLGTSLVLGTLIALSLSALFRLGVRRTAALEVVPGRVSSKTLRRFMEKHGAAWGARRDVIELAAFNLAQSIETLVASGVTHGPLAVTATFDEFNLDVRIAYDGPPLELPDVRPSPEEILDTEDGERRLAGYLLRRCADMVEVTRDGARSTILFHFDH